MATLELSIFGLSESSVKLSFAVELFYENRLETYWDVINNCITYLCDFLHFRE